ncbi:hypothetical protein BGZ70_003766 [Mortierella alpina]|uniref:Ubiquitin-like domain-containing protein n=1 Tax=Mortierella alpina TaxID=64518 RepID=A0A9P6LW40_MORAP|nr:hypothetical protein BGZ70_003766 [Mortierella alpina]
MIDIQVTIKSLKSGQWTVDVSAQGTIADLKEALQAKAGIDASSQRLVLKGKALLDNKSLEEYGLTSGSVVHLFAKAGAAASPTTPSTSPAIAGVASSTTEGESASTSTSGAAAAASANVTSAVAGPTAAVKRPVVTSYRGLSEAGTEIARDAEFWYWLNDQLKERLGSKEDASQMMKGFLGQYRDLIGNAGTKEIEGQIKK